MTTLADHHIWQDVYRPMARARRAYPNLSVEEEQSGSTPAEAGPGEDDHRRRFRRRGKWLLEFPGDVAHCLDGPEVQPQSSQC